MIIGATTPRTGGWCNVERAQFSFPIYVCDNVRNVYTSDCVPRWSNVALAVGTGFHSGVNTAPTPPFSGEETGWPLQNARPAAQEAVDVLHDIVNSYRQPAPVGDLPDPVAGVLGGLP
jgi:hypothetical protein